MTVGGDEPTGADGVAAPIGATGPTGSSLPDTAVIAGQEVVPLGILLVFLAALMAAVRREPWRQSR